MKKYIYLLKINGMIFANGTLGMRIRKFVLGATEHFFFMLIAEVVLKHIV